MARDAHLIDDVYRRACRPCLECPDLWCGDHGEILHYLLIKDGVVFSDDGAESVPVSDVGSHNQAYDQLLLRNLDDRCEIGQGGILYITQDNCGWVIETKMRRIVSREVSVVNGLVTFHRNGKLFRGRMSSRDDILHFTRVKA